MSKKKSLAVFSFLNTPSGSFSWWDDFPHQITIKLNDKHIDHKCFYRDFTENSIYPISEQNLVKPNSWAWLLEIYYLAKDYDNVIFHTHSYYPPLKLYLLTLFSTKRIWVITEHRLGDGTPKKWKKFLRIFLRKLKLMPKKVIAVSDAVSNRNKLLYGNNVIRIHNGIKLEGSNSTSNSSEAKIALYVGRLDPKKGIWNLIKAFDILVNQHHKNDLKLHVVGGGALLNELKSFTVSKQLTNNIIFHGYQVDPSKYYANADFQVIPTVVQEACPLVALEARSFNLPILYANRGGLPETVGKGGIPLLGLTPELISQSIVNLSKDSKKYKSLLNVGNDGLEYFSIDRMTDEYVELYIKILYKSAKTHL
ncbi:glycosyltransferase family 4 protein [Colwellia demingiae]|uniref:Glycosyltransferase family 4 protein n=1 Tax=Colwellia demingiae TaxID=89401 RepID=A0A5C6QQM6_9GAMM|nr:glycosyltransferase family 4 protein [Colwellia demingiae]TWX71033.1 glycosyltransferase family 4 protein [Colwellia demingiae]